MCTELMELGLKSRGAEVPQKGPRVHTGASWGFCSGQASNWASPLLPCQQKRAQMNPKLLAEEQGDAGPASSTGFAELAAKCPPGHKGRSSAQLLQSTLPSSRQASASTPTCSVRFPESHGLDSGALSLAAIQATCSPHRTTEGSQPRLSPRKPLHSPLLSTTQDTQTLLDPVPFL